jgi:threonine synthase
MMGFQAAGAAPIVLGEIVEDPQTFASAIRIGNPASWRYAEAARDESQGAIDSVTDDEILAAYQRMAREEGIYCEPASAASVAGLIKAASSTDLRGQTCVCIITGNGLKDPDTAKTFDYDEITVAPRLDAIESALLR